jgi:hypothetical protein
MMSDKQPKPGLFAEARRKHKIETCRICQDNLRLKAEGSERRVYALDGIHGDSLID